METRIQVKAGEIERIHAHLRAGHEVACITYTRCTVMNKPLHIDYIRADGNGYRLGWPGKKSVYCLAQTMFLIAPGFTLNK